MSEGPVFTKNHCDGFLEDVSGFEDDTFFFVEGPRFPNGDFTSIEHESRMKYEKWTIRKTAFREKLDVLAQAHAQIYLKQKPNWENILAKIESDVQFIFEYLEMA
jgi:hypothetical protein